MCEGARIARRAHVLDLVLNVRRRTPVVLYGIATSPGTRTKRGGVESGAPCACKACSPQDDPPRNGCERQETVERTCARTDRMPNCSCSPSSLLPNLPQDALQGLPQIRRMVARSCHEVQGSGRPAPPQPPWASTSASSSAASASSSPPGSCSSPSALLAFVDRHCRSPPVRQPLDAPEGLDFFTTSAPPPRPLGLEERLLDVAEILAVHLQRHRLVADDLDAVEVVRVEHVPVARVAGEHRVRVRTSERRRTRTGATTSRPSSKSASGAIRSGSRFAYVYGSAFATNANAARPSPSPRARARSARRARRARARSRARSQVAGPPAVLARGPSRRRAGRPPASRPMPGREREAAAVDAAERDPARAVAARAPRRAGARRRPGRAAARARAAARSCRRRAGSRSARRPRARSGPR